MNFLDSFRNVCRFCLNEQLEDLKLIEAHEGIHQLFYDLTEYKVINQIFVASNLLNFCVNLLAIEVFRHSG